MCQRISNETYQKSFDTIARCERDGLVTKKDARGLRLALAEAMKSALPFHVGCVLINKNRSILSRGYNSNKTNPIQQRYDLAFRDFRPCNGRCNSNAHSLHAEMSALMNISKADFEATDFSNVTAYVVRLAEGLPMGQGLALPCGACSHALFDAGIRRVVASTDSGFVTVVYDEQSMTSDTNMIRDRITKAKEGDTLGLMLTTPIK